jgi:hypothetical protein
MKNFSSFGKAVHNAFNTILQNDAERKDSVFVVDVTGDDLWAHYLASFPEGTNPIFRTRTEYDCSCCKNFIRNIGAVVSLKDGKLQSVWDVEVDDELFQTIADSMSKFVKALSISRPFIVSEPSYGAEVTHSNDETWHHFHAKVPTIFMWKHNKPDYVGERQNDFEGLKRSIKEIDNDAIEQVADLIDQDSLHKGPEYKGKVDQLRKLKAAYAKLKTKRARELFLWANAHPGTRFHSTMIGTLLVDLTNGEDLEIAVKKYEDKASGTNFKRSKALVTQKMIDEAQKLVEKLGIEDSLARRFAVREDISVNDVLFVDGSVKKKLLGGAFDSIKPTKKNVPVLTDLIEDISIKDFLSKVLPKADTVEVFVRNEHQPTFVSLIAPVNADSKPLFKWDNGFSWAYTGDATESIRERVKKAGGKVDGDIRISLSWHNATDLDLSLHKNGTHIYYHNRNEFGATLDLDMNGLDKHDTTAPVENIVWPRKANAQPGTYSIVVHNYASRATANVGFEVEVEVMGKLYSYENPKGLRDNEKVKVGEVIIAKGGEVTVVGLTEGGASNEKWGVHTETWTPVDLITRSPNFWNDQKIGHEHIFFMLKNCVRDDSARGFYNEYLRDDLNTHRKVFEVVGAQMRVAPNDQQLSGLGFSITKRDEIKVRVKGATNRVLNVKF